MQMKKKQEREVAKPVGQGEYLVKQGDCISSIALKTGHFWDKIWNDPGNSELKEVRKDSNVLLPGDRVTIPDLTPKQESGGTEMRHRFVRRGVPALFRLRLLALPLPDEGSASDTMEEEEPSFDQQVDEDVPPSAAPGVPEQQKQQTEPLANEPYEFFIDGGRGYTGCTDENGALSIPIPPNARRAWLFVGTGSNRKRYEFDLGHVDPVKALNGVQQRLNNLGFDAGTADGRYGPQTRGALERFQRSHGLPETGQPDEQTRQRLVREHGS